MTANREDEHNLEAEVGDGFCLMLGCNECHYRSQIITNVTRSGACKERARALGTDLNSTTSMRNPRIG